MFFTEKKRYYAIFLNSFDFLRFFTGVFFGGCKARLTKWGKIIDDKLIGMIKKFEKVVGMVCFFLINGRKLVWILVVVGLLRFLLKMISRKSFQNDSDLFIMA